MDYKILEFHQTHTWHNMKIHRAKNFLDGRKVYFHNLTPGTRMPL